LLGFFLILALPLLNLPPWFSPPDWGKTIVFRIILSILIFVFIYEILSKKRLSIKTSLPLWLLITLLGTYSLATIFSLDRNFSLWGSPYRSGGFVNFAFYIIFAILAFLILDKSDWQKIWDFSIFVGILVSLIALFQQFGLFSKIFIEFGERPPSTLGTTISLAIYLLLLIFPTLSFGMEAKKLFKKCFYILSFLLFIFVIIFVTQTRAAIIGLFVGFLYFAFFYPSKKRLVSLILKAVFFISVIFLVLGFYYINTHSLPDFIQRNKILREVVGRFTIKTILSDSRFSAWRVSWQALKQRPLLGYGLENFSIGFDKYFDPSLPGIGKPPGDFPSGWWDRAHNFVFDIALTGGVTALIIYLLLFGFLFWYLEKIKHKETEKIIIVQGIQTAFIGYLVANFFSFDSFSTYLISFLLIGFSLTLISEEVPEKTFLLNFEGKTVITCLLFLSLIWFVYVFNWKPLKINGQINNASHFVNAGNCKQAISRMETMLSQKSFLDSYFRIKYFEFLGKCKGETAEEVLESTKEKITMLEESVKIQPYYTRSWIFLGSTTNILIESENNPENIKKLKNGADGYFERAKNLSPKRQEIYIEWAITDLLTGDYQKAKEKAQNCINLNNNLGDCYWSMAIATTYSGEFEKAKENITIAGEKGYAINSEVSLLELARAYLQNKNYEEMIKIYQKLIEIKPDNPNYYLALAFTYKENGEFEKAKKEALKLIDLPPYKDEINKFLKELP
jgi:tetratricopeptide (TPR) repeat protein/O-antigen ligase